jgi:hypothetical protein
MPLTPEQEALKQAAQKALDSSDGWPFYLRSFEKRANPAAILALLAQLEAAHAVPDILFAGHAVYEEITRKLGKEHCISAAAVSTTLDAAVRLIRAAPGDPAQ